VSHLLALRALVAPAWKDRIMSKCPLEHPALIAAASALGGALVTYAVLKGGKPSCDKPAAAVAAVDETPVESTDIYETMDSALRYMDFQFANEVFAYNKQMPIGDGLDFCVRLAKKFDEHKPVKTNGRGLDLGCATGRSVFEMTPFFDEVVGVDLSSIFINFANKMKTETKYSFQTVGQGLNSVTRTVELGAHVVPERCTFVVGDAMAVDPALGKFDALLAANLLCRVPSPRKLLKSFSGLINQGGVLIIVSPYSWWEGASNKAEWLGGLPGGASSEEIAKAFLSEDFVLLAESDEPFMIPDHHRRYQVGFSHCTVWRRK
jgi:putative 4-mercaptohistidine N1-methyltranferase